jgi:type V secretory pathway adhesin AidA
MSRAPKDTRSAAEKARDTAGIVGNLKHEGYVPTPEAEAVHQRVARGEITAEEAIEIFRQRALKLDVELNARKRRIERA